MNEGATFGPVRMESVSGTAPVQLLASVAVTVKLKGPDAVGVPSSTPAAESVSPAGSAPAVRLHVTGAVPPVCVKLTGPYATLIVPPGTTIGLTVIVAHAAVVNGTVTSAAGVSGGSSVSTSVIWLATMRSVHAVLRGRSTDGSSVKVVAGLGVRLVSAIGVPVGHSSTNAPAPTVTGSLKVTVRFASMAMPVAFAAGVVLMTDGAVSPGAAAGIGIAGAAPPPENGTPFTERYRA